MIWPEDSEVQDNGDIVLNNTILYDHDIILCVILWALEELEIPNILQYINKYKILLHLKTIVKMTSRIF